MPYIETTSETILSCLDEYVVKDDLDSFNRDILFYRERNPGMWINVKECEDYYLLLAARERSFCVMNSIIKHVYGGYVTLNNPILWEIVDLDDFDVTQEILSHVPYESKMDLTEEEDDTVQCIMEDCCNKNKHSVVKLFLETEWYPISSVNTLIFEALSASEGNAVETMQILFEYGLKPFYTTRLEFYPEILKHAINHAKIGDQRMLVLLAQHARNESLEMQQQIQRYIQEQYS